jgi:poly(hydroxyalkanoate) depolymerase family esterase
MLCAGLTACGATTVSGTPAGTTGTGTATVVSAKTALPPPASTLRRVTGFGPNPTGLGMYLYVPRHVRPHPPVIVALHGCGASGPFFFRETEFASLADKYGFAVIYPSVTRKPLVCFDVSRPGALTRDGNSDPAAIVSMVRYVEAHLHADRHLVFAAGYSSGAMTTNALLADYPDVFAAGSAMSGTPFGCFATTDGSLWNSGCAEGRISKTPQQWGNLVRAADPGYSGPRPRVQLFHGTADAILRYPNFGEEVKQWTDVLHARLASTARPRPGWTHAVYVNSAGGVEVDAYSVDGEGHGLVARYPDWARLAISFFGLTR